MTSFAYPSFILNADSLDEKIALLRDSLGDCHSLTCLSVRTAFDLLLSTLNFTPGDEIIMTAVNISHMFRIAVDHGLKIVTADINADTLTPDLNYLKSLITPRTRAIVAAHLYGAKADLTPVRKAIKGSGILLIEDSSQYFQCPGEKLLSDVRLIASAR